MPLSRAEPSLGELFSRLSQDLSLLVRQEVDLAKAEMRGKAREAVSDMASLIAGALLANAALLTIIATLVMLIAGVDAWKAALVVAIIVAAGAFFLVRSGLNNLRQLDPAPRRTQASVRADLQVAKEALR